MTASTNHQHNDSAEQLERLSAYLDDELDETERTALEQHLPTCEECRSLLAELRETRSLLRAMPAPTLPRSFRVPETGAIPQPLAGARRPTATTRTADQRRGARVLQWVGGMVATLGVLLFVGTTVLSSGNVYNGSTSSAAAAGPLSTSSVSPHYPSTTQQSTRQSSGNLFPPSATATVVVPVPTRSGTTYSPTNQESTPPFGPIAGALLLIVGAVLLLAGTFISRRRVLA